MLVIHGSVSLGTDALNYCLNLRHHCNGSLKREFTHTVDNDSEPDGFLFEIRCQCLSWKICLFFKIQWTQIQIITLLCWKGGWLAGSQARNYKEKIACWRVSVYKTVYNQTLQNIVSNSLSQIHHDSVREQMPQTQLESWGRRLTLFKSDTQKQLQLHVWNKYDLKKALRTQVIWDLKC